MLLTTCIYCKFFIVSKDVSFCCILLQLNYCPLNNAFIPVVIQIDVDEEGRSLWSHNVNQ